MKVKLNRQELVEALTAIGQVAASRTPKPILQCVLIDVRPDHCLLAATDLELSLLFRVNLVQVDAQGQVVLPADKLGQIVRESTDEVVELESEDTICHVRGLGAHFQLNTQDPADFPPVSELKEEPDFEVEARTIRHMAEWTVFAAARENTRYAINGVLWQCQKGEITLVATDGRRLALARGKVASEQGAALDDIVPVKAMSLFQRIVHDSDPAAAVKKVGNQLIVKTAKATISTGLVEGQFPDYAAVVPKDCDRSVTLKTAEFLSAVRRGALLTNEESKGVRLAFSEGTLTLSSRAPSQGEATIDLPVQFSGPELVIGFNPFFLIEALKVVQTEDVQFDLKDPNRPGVLRCPPDNLYVVMPVNLS